MSWAITAKAYQLLPKDEVFTNGKRTTGRLVFERKLAFYKKLQEHARTAQERKLKAAANRSKTYTHSRRVLTMKASAAHRRELGFQANEPTCVCGTCDLCKARKRQKKNRQRDSGFYWDHEQATPPFDAELHSTLQRIGAL